MDNEAVIHLSPDVCLSNIEYTSGLLIPHPSPSPLGGSLPYYCSPTYLCLFAPVRYLRKRTLSPGLSTFGHHCEGHKLHVWSDNKGSEHATRRGSAKAWDHNHVVHALWVKAAMLRCHMVVDRVPTKVNIADLPSREEYWLLHQMQTLRVEPVIDAMFWSSDAWDTLPLRGALR